MSYCPFFGVSVGFPSCQLVVVVMGFFAITCSFLNRVNLSVALLKMINNTYVYEEESKIAKRSYKTACPGADITVNDTKVRIICSSLF